MANKDKNKGLERSTFGNVVPIAVAKERNTDNITRYRYHIFELKVDKHNQVGIQ